MQEGEGSLRRRPYRACPEAESVLGRSTKNRAASSMTKPSPAGSRAPRGSSQGARAKLRHSQAPVQTSPCSVWPVSLPQARSRWAFLRPWLRETGEVWAETPGLSGCTEGTLGLVGTQPAHCRLTGHGRTSHARASRGQRQRGCPAASETSQQRKLRGDNHRRTKEGRGLSSGCGSRHRRQAVYLHHEGTTTTEYDGRHSCVEGRTKSLDELKKSSSFGKVKPRKPLLCQLRPNPSCV